MVQQHCWLGAANREPTLGREPTVRAEPTDDAGARADIWSIQGDFNYRHHSELRVSTLRAEGRNIHYSGSTLMLPGQHIRIWMSYKKSRLTIIGMSFVQKFVRFLDRIFKVHSIERKNPPQGYMWSGRRLTKIHTTTKLRLWSGSKDENWQRHSESRKNKNWQKRNWSWTMLEKWKEFTLLIQMSENLRKFFKRKKKTGKAHHQVARRICLWSPK